MLAATGYCPVVQRGEAVRAVDGREADAPVATTMSRVATGVDPFITKYDILASRQLRKFNFLVVSYFLQSKQLKLVADHDLAQLVPTLDSSLLKDRTHLRSNCIRRFS